MKILFSIGKQVLHEVSLPIDDYEQSRAPRRGQSQMRIPQEVRQEMLMNIWHIPFSQIREKTTEINKIREQRRKDLKNYYQRKSKNWKNILLCRRQSKDVISLSLSNGKSRRGSVDESQEETPFLQPKVSSIILSKIRNANEGNGKESFRNELDISNRGRILLDDMDDNQQELSANFLAFVEINL